MFREFWDKNQKWIIVVVGMLLFMTAGYIATSFPHRQQNPAGNDEFVPKAALETARPTVPEPDKEEETAAAAAVPVVDLPSDWILYITGAVRKPGVYKLPAGSRLLQLVSAAGGLSMIADPTAVNLAAFLEDGMHVHVPGKGDDQPAYTAYIGVTPYVRVSTDPGQPETNSPNAGLLKIGLPKAGLPKTGLPVDINRATAEELTALKGIGPALAARIVDYRLTNGRFTSVDDLLHIRGIGPKTLEQFRNDVVIRP